MKLVISNQGMTMLNEDHQAVDIRFSLGIRENGSIRNLMPWIMCRDYFNDVIYVQKSRDEQHFHQYGFGWDYNEELNTQWSNGPAYLLLTCKDNKVLDRVYQNRKVLRSLDKKVGFKRTIITKESDYICEDDAGWHHVHGKYLLLFKIDSRWFHNSVMMSLYTLIVRMLAAAPATTRYMDYTHFIWAMRAHKPFARDNSDWGLIKDILKNPWHLDIVLENHKTIFSGGGVPYSRDQHDELEEEWDDFEEKIHNYSGIQSFFHGLTYPRQEPSDTIHPFIKEARTIVNRVKEEYNVHHYDFT